MSIMNLFTSRREVLEYKRHEKIGEMEFRVYIFSLKYKQEKTFDIYYKVNLTCPTFTGKSNFDEEYDGWKTAWYLSETNELIGFVYCDSKIHFDILVYKPEYEFLNDFILSLYLHKNDSEAYKTFYFSCSDIMTNHDLENIQKDMSEHQNVC